MRIGIESGRERPEGINGFDFVESSDSGVDVVVKSMPLPEGMRVERASDGPILIIETTEAAILGEGVFAVSPGTDLEPLLHHIQGLTEDGL